MDDELEVLKYLFRGTFQEPELVDIFYRHRNKYRVMVSLLQQPRFPEKHALGIIPKLFPIDLVKISKNKLTNPNIRKRIELEFASKFPRFPLGEKISYIKIAPGSILEFFIEETDPRILDAILHNEYVTEELILKFINRKNDHMPFYEALSNSEWFKRPSIAEAISLDNHAPIKILSMIIPYLNLRHLEQLFVNTGTHQIVKRNIREYLESR